MKIYFAGSIRGGRDDQALYFEIINLLTQYGKVLTEHIGNNDLSILGEEKLSDEYIYERDMAWINEADVVVAEVSSPSLGVGYEIGKVEGRKPILCLFRKQDGRKISAMIMGNNNMVTKEYKGLSDITEILKEFFSKNLGSSSIG